jgi:Tfp pilus assembly protein PilO
VVRDCDVAQAAEFIRALKQQLHEMTARLARLERQAVTDALRLEAAALSRDIQEAQFMIDGLRRRYLSGDQRTRQHPVGRRPLALIDRTRREYT